MTTNNFQITEVSPSQSNKTPTINAAIQQLESLISDQVSIAVTGDFILPDNDFNRNVYFLLTGALGAAATMALPARSKLFVVENTTGQTITVEVDPENDGPNGATVDVPNGQANIIYSNGTNITLISGGGGASGPSVVDWKESVRFATTVDGADATAFEAGTVHDGVTAVAGDRFLRKDQTNPAENGIFVVNATGAPTRAEDFDEDAEVTAGATVYVEEGTVNGSTLFILTTTGTIVVGTTGLTFAPLTAGAASANLLVAPVSFKGATAIFNADKAAQSLDPAAIISWDAAPDDTNSFFDPLQPTRLTIPAGVSKVRLIAQVGALVPGIAANEEYVSQITKNGSRDYIGIAPTGGRTGFNNSTSSAFTAVLDVIPGDYFEVRYLYQGSTSVTLDASSSHFQIEVIEGDVLNPGAPTFAINEQNGASYTAAVTDLNALVLMNAAGNNDFIIPPSSVVPMPVGAQLLCGQSGAGVTRIVAGAGVTTQSRGNAFRSAGQHSLITMVQVALDVWTVSGDLVV